MQGKRIAKKKVLLACKLCSMLCMALVVVVGWLMPRDVTIYAPGTFDTLETGWHQQTSEGNLYLEILSDCQDVQVGTPIVLTRAITEDMIDKCLLFYAEHQMVTVTVNEHVIFQTQYAPQLERFGTPGRAWVSVPLSEEMVGQPLILTLDSNFSSYHHLPDFLYCVDEDAIYAIQFKHLWLRNTATLFLLGIAVISYINGHIWKQRRLRRFLFSMADLYMFVGLWLCAEVNVLAIWMGRAPLSAVLAMILVRFVPIGFYYFFSSMLPYTSWRTRLMKWVVWGNLVLSMVLQFGFGVSLLHLAPLQTAVDALGCLLALMEIVCYYRSRMQFLGYASVCYWTAVLFVGGLMECHISQNYQQLGQWMGVPIAIACAIYSGAAHVFMVHNESITATEKTSLQKTVQNMQKSPLNQQINAHFLYNSLNTISAYCKEDAAKADEAIQLLGKYTRAYTYLMGASDYVDLEEELDLMQTYMALQNLRFGHSIAFQVENECQDVLLPPLTLQPLVENAINHGIRKRQGDGIVVITACYKHHMAEITVSDNGVGFDVKYLEKGVGLENLEHRIQAMGGSLTVQSAIGKGTCVILMVPQQAAEQAGFDHFICG